jgi:hypothetical protein
VVDGSSNLGPVGATATTTPFLLNKLASYKPAKERQGQWLVHGGEDGQIVGSVRAGNGVGGNSVGSAVERG